jgi:hypothetical protein
MMALLSGASVWRPTMISFPWSIYPGGWDVMELGV